MPASRHYRRWAFESAALDLALRQAGLPLHEALERDPKPLQFVCSTRLTSFDDEAGSTTEPISKRLAKYPGLEFKLDPENDWTPELIAEIGELADRPGPRSQGSLPGHPGRRRDRSRALPAGGRGVPRAHTSRIPTSTTRLGALLEPLADRVTWDAPLHSLADITGRSSGSRRRSTRSRRASARCRSCSPSTSTATARGSRSTAAGRARSRSVAARSSTWRRCFIPTPPTTPPPPATTTRPSRRVCRLRRWTRFRRRPASAGAEGRLTAGSADRIRPLGYGRDPHSDPTEDR